MNPHQPFRRHLAAALAVILIVSLAGGLALLL